MHPGPGFRVRKNIPRADNEALIDRYREFGTPDISDLCNRMYAMSSEIKNLVNETKIVGIACTVKIFPGDNLMVHKALDIANPGDVIVVDSSGSTTNAVIGDLVAAKAKHRGIAGFIIDGLIRDLPEVKNVGLPIFAKGVTPVGPLHRGPGEINFPVSCGGIVVNAGDIICADITGIVVVRQDFAGDILQRLDEQRAGLEEYVAAVRRGDFSNAWVDRLLEETLCNIIDD
jgi:RraA family protein